MFPMVFSSITFLWIFLPIVLIAYYSFSFIKQEKAKFLCKNTSLLIASLIFYAWGGDFLFIDYASVHCGKLFYGTMDKFLQKKEL